jgi:hypothetical protein
MALDDFKQIEIQHKEIFKKFFLQDPPDISEFTFTNLFMWRHKYHPVWLQREDCLLLILRPEQGSPFGLQPVGRGDKSRALDLLCDQLREMTPEPKVCRANEDFVKKHVDSDRYVFLSDPDNNDYVYRSLDLIQLSGRRYHRKKNHLNRFIKNNNFEYLALDMDLVECFLDLQEEWCQLKECAEDSSLLSEDYAIYTALTCFEDLGISGGAIRIDSKLEAFSLGEPLNNNTAVIHIEKANSEIPGLYSVINQMFCSNAWSHMEYINREQDLGIEGLRKAKESYYPHHMVYKYTVMPK